MALETKKSIMQAYICERGKAINLFVNRCECARITYYVNYMVRVTFLSGAWLKLSIVRLPDESKFALGQVNTRVHV